MSVINFEHLTISPQWYFFFTLRFSISEVARRNGMFRRHDVRWGEVKWGMCSEIATATCPSHLTPPACKILVELQCYYSLTCVEGARNISGSCCSYPNITLVKKYHSCCCVTRRAFVITTLHHAFQVLQFIYPLLLNDLLPYHSKVCLDFSSSPLVCTCVCSSIIC